MAKIKKDRSHKNDFVAFRLNSHDMHVIQIKANIYTEGNVSAFCRHAALNYEVNMNDLEDPELDKLIMESAYPHLRRKDRKKRSIVKK